MLAVAQGLVAQTVSPIPDDSPRPAEESGLTLDQIEQQALAVSPVIGQAVARIEALRGKRLQAGLPPNPRVGIVGSDLFDDGNFGRAGVFFGRQVVRGGKLQLSQQVVDAELAAAEQQLQIVRQRLLTDVRRRYFDALLAQQQVELTEILVQRLQQTVDVSRDLVAANEAALTTSLQAEIELENAIARRKQAENDRTAAFSQLATLLNESQLADQRLAGDIRDIPPLQPIETVFDQLIATSPELQALTSEIEVARRRIRRACAEPIPDVTWQTSISYDTGTDHMVGGLQVGMPIPVLNRNEGAIAQARHELVLAQRKVEQKLLDLRGRLINEYRQYNDARIQVETYESSILPKSEQTLDLTAAGYRQGEVGFLDVLTAQRTYTETQLGYLNRLRQMRQQVVLIEGQLLNNALSSPATR